MDEINRGFFPDTIGERITFLRKQAGMTQAQLAEHLDISPQAVSKWESGLSCPDIMMLVPLASLFHVSTDSLLGAKSGAGIMPEIKNAESVVSAEAETPIIVESGDGSMSGNGSKTQLILPQGKVDNLYLDLGATEAIIQEGDKFSVEFRGYTPESCHSRLENGTWKIKNTIGYQAVFSFMRFFSDRKVIVTIPAGYCFQEVYLGIGAGSIEVNGMSTEKSSLNVGAGEIKLKRFYSGSSKIRCSVGTLRLEGALSGKCKLDCGMGDVNLLLDTPPEYGYNVNVGVGQVSIGEDSICGLGGHYQIRKNAPTVFYIDCGAGNVNIKFKA